MMYHPPSGRAEIVEGFNDPRVRLIRDGSYMGLNTRLNGLSPVY